MTHFTKQVRLLAYILLASLWLFTPLMTVARENPPPGTKLKPFSKQVYLNMPDYLQALEKEKKAKQEAKLAKQNEKRAERQAKGKRVAAKEAEKKPTAIAESDVVRYIPYDAGKELDLWMLESKKFFRSEPVLPPDQSGYAYTEVGYLPHNRQTYSTLFWVPLTALPEEAPLLPSEAETPNQTRDARFYQDRLNPDKTIQIRKELLGVGNNRQVGYEFRTLTIVDWSASSKRVLFKQRSGVLHVGLKVSDILIYDRQHGTITIYPELQRILQHYWLTHSAYQDLDTVAWDIYPIGWVPGSDNEVVFKAWAYDNKATGKSKRVFLGLWKYDVDSQRSELLSLENVVYPTVVNGRVPDFSTPLKIPAQAPINP